MDIYVSTSSFLASSYLQDRVEDFSLAYNPIGKAYTKSDVLGRYGNAIGVIAGTEMLDGNTMKSMPNLKVISRCGAGIDNIDMAAAKELGIKVFNTPDAPTQPVAELTLGLILDMLRRISSHDRELRQGVWKKQMGNLLQGKKVGFVGFGRIGQRLAKFMEPFDAEIAYNAAKGKKADVKAAFMTLPEMLAWSDILTLHLPKQPQAVIGAAEIAMMRPGTWLVNAARGGLVDEVALQAALETGHLAGAALDVFDQEPYEGPLTQLDNVVMTSHVGSYAKEARLKMEMEAVDNLLKGLAEL
jgi:D-3-phosphoglycerate dehydrogenase